MKASILLLFCSWFLIFLPIYLRDRAGKGSDCWPAVKTIASDLQLSRSTVKRALHDLVHAGLIEKESRYRENGSNTSNRLILKK